ncbi:hypothetical protein IF2G_03147 [Cordyceps javanica]|nr:hypothetical protein IF2G_03147 [Cordyceps javanica]
MKGPLTPEMRTMCVACSGLAEAPQSPTGNGPTPSTVDVLLSWLLACYITGRIIILVVSPGRPVEHLCRFSLSSFVATGDTSPYLYLSAFLSRPTGFVLPQLRALWPG